MKREPIVWRSVLWSETREGETRTSKSLMIAVIPGRSVAHTRIWKQWRRRNHIRDPKLRAFCVRIKKVIQEGLKPA